MGRRTLRLAIWILALEVGLAVWLLRLPELGLSPSAQTVASALAEISPPR